MTEEKKEGTTEERVKLVEQFKAQKIKEIAANYPVIPRALEKSIKLFINKIDLAEQFLKVQPLYYDKAKNWWLWNAEQFKWELIDEVDLLNSINKQSNADTINSKEKTEILEALKQTARLNLPHPIKKTWIQFKGTIYDIKTGVEFQAGPEWFVTNPLPYQLHEDRFVETPTMDAVFEEWVGKDNVKILYEILAYCMLPDYPIHRMFCFIGSGSNGKSCYLRLLRKFIGEYNCCSTELDTLMNSRFEVTRLYKKLVCQMGETNFNEISKTSIIKKLTGQDMIGYEYKNKTPFEDLNYAKILISTNNLPVTTDKTLGFYRRWTIIDFPNKFGEMKDILDDIPEEEYEILAVKCCLILKDLLDNRKFTGEGSMEDRKEKYEAKSNFLDKFIKEFTEVDEQSYITVSEFNRKFISWCKENRHREMSESTIGLEMKRQGYLQDRVYFQWMYEGKGGQARCWMGLKWK